MTSFVLVFVFLYEINEYRTTFSLQVRMIFILKEITRELHRWHHLIPRKLFHRNIPTVPISYFYFRFSRCRKEVRLHEEILVKCGRAHLSYLLWFCNDGFEEIVCTEFQNDVCLIPVPSTFPTPSMPNDLEPLPPGLERYLQKITNLRRRPQSLCVNSSTRDQRFAKLNARSPSLNLMIRDVVQVVDRDEMLPETLKLRLN